MSLYIETPRLILRPPTIDDVEDMQRAKEAVWPELQLWMSWAYDDERPIEALIKNTMTVPQVIAEGGCPLLGRCRQSGTFVLRTGLNVMDDRPGVLETGYWVAKEFLGKGYATEATNAAIRYAFNAMAARTIYICHFEGNEPSRRVIEKLGFTKIGVAPKAHARCSDGVLLDKHEYSMKDPAVLPSLDVRWREQGGNYEL